MDGQVLAKPGYGKNIVQMPSAASKDQTFSVTYQPLQNQKRSHSHPSHHHVHHHKPMQKMDSIPKISFTPNESQQQQNVGAANLSTLEHSSSSPVLFQSAQLQSFAANTTTNKMDAEAAAKQQQLSLKLSLSPKPSDIPNFAATSKHRIRNASINYTTGRFYLK